MLETLDESFAGLFLVGYHAPIGAERGMMDHSYSASCIYRVRLNGIEAGETEINAALAGWYGVPVCFVSGDDVLESCLAGKFNPAPVYVRTKEGLGRFAGKLYPPERLESLFVDGAASALAGLGAYRPIKAAAPTRVDIDLVSTVVADAVSVIPGVVRTSGRSISYESADFRDVYRMIHVAAMLGGKFAAFT
jgi:D-amino peptidase